MRLQFLLTPRIIDIKSQTLLVTSKAASMKHEISFGSSPAAALYFALFLLILLIR